MDIKIDSYSDKSFVLRGDTKPHKDKIKLLGGKWNANLQGGGGWIFPNTAKPVVEHFIRTGEIKPKERKISSPKQVHAFSSILTIVEKHILTLTPQERLLFLADVSTLCAIDPKPVEDEIVLIEEDETPTPMLNRKK